VTVRTTDRMKPTLALALLLAPVPAFAADPPGWHPDRFPIGFWEGPPDAFVTPERFKQIADAGFTFTFPSNSSTAANTASNRKLLDCAHANGLKAFISDGRMAVAIGGDAAVKARLDAVVADYSSHPGLGGYFVGDEPSPPAFAGLGEVVAHLRAKDPAHPAYVNLYPNYAPEWAIGPTYEGHVDSFVRTVKPFAVSYDHYHFTKTGDGPLFFDNLDTVRRVSAKHGLPFWNIVLAIEHGGYRKLTEAEKRFEAMQTLAYGGKGLLWFTYWQPGKDWGEAIIQLDGTPTRHYAEVARINADVQAIGKHLLPATCLGVLTQGPTPGVPARLSGPAVTVGVFRSDGDHFALLANRDYKSAADAVVLLATGGRPVRKLDKATGRWADVPTEPAGGEVRVRVRLAAGDGELVRW
jgi:hypothetical protein